MRRMFLMVIAVLVVVMGALYLTRFSPPKDPSRVGQADAPATHPGETENQVIVVEAMIDDLICPNPNTLLH